MLSGAEGGSKTSPQPPRSAQPDLAGTKGSKLNSGGTKYGNGNKGGQGGAGGTAGAPATTGEACPTYRNYGRDETLEAFGPLAKLAEGNTSLTARKVAEQITQQRPRLVDACGRELTWVKVRVDEVAEPAGYMKYEIRDPRRRAEEMAAALRRSKRAELLSKRRELFAARTPEERSASPMFGKQGRGAEQEGDGFYTSRDRPVDNEEDAGMEEPTPHRGGERAEAERAQPLGQQP